MIEYKRSIPVDAIDVAALIGFNKYRTHLHELVVKYWKRGSPRSFREAEPKLEKEG